jgi:hypothetical protein
VSRHILLVQSDAADERHDEFNSWYDEEHLPAVLNVPGFVAARRFVASPGIHGETPPHRYVAIYEIETDDLPGALTALSTAAQGMHIHAAFDRSAHETYAFTQVTRLP